MDSKWRTKNWGLQWLIKLWRRILDETEAVTYVNKHINYTTMLTVSSQLIGVVVVFFKLGKWVRFNPETITSVVFIFEMKFSVWNNKISKCLFICRMISIYSIATMMNHVFCENSLQLFLRLWTFIRSKCCFNTNKLWISFRSYNSCRMIMKCGST